MSVSANNRRYEGRRLTRVGCQVVRERDFRLIGDLMLDVSLEGMLVRTSASVLTGESVIVSFQAPRTRIWIDAEATVVRVGHGRRPTDSGRSLGLVFDKLPGRERALLRSTLLGLPFRPVTSGRVLGAPMSIAAA